MAGLVAAPAQRGHGRAPAGRPAARPRRTRAPRARRPRATCRRPLLQRMRRPRRPPCAGASGQRGASRSWGARSRSRCRPAAPPPVHTQGLQCLFEPLLQPGTGALRRASNTSRASMPPGYFQKLGQTAPGMWVLSGCVGVVTQPRPACQTQARSTKLHVRTEQKKACGLATGCGGCFAAGLMGSSAQRRSSSCCQGAIVVHPCMRACKKALPVGNVLRPQHEEPPDPQALCCWRRGIIHTTLSLPASSADHAARAGKLCPTCPPLLIVMGPSIAGNRFAGKVLSTGTSCCPEAVLTDDPQATAWHAAAACLKGRVSNLVRLSPQQAR